LRVPNYDYDTHFGGVFYLFVRGVRPDWKNADGTSSGVFFDRPNKNAIADLDQLFASFQAKVA
jgi:exodeoxyribonuclease V beta subunit